MTVTALDNLIPVTLNGETKTRYEHAGRVNPKFVKYLRTFGEAGIVKNMKDGKVGDRGITMLFVGYSSGHAGNCYRMYNLVTSRVCESRDIIWMGRMYFTSPNCKKTQLLPVIAVPITNDLSSNDLAVTEVMKVMLLNSASWEGTIVDGNPNTPTEEGWKTVTRGGRKSIPTQRYEPSTGKTVTWNVTATDMDLEIKKCPWLNTMMCSISQTSTRLLLHRCITKCTWKLLMLALVREVVLRTSRSFKL